MVLKAIPIDELDISARSSNSLPVRVLSHNVRYTPHHLLPNERPWNERLPLLIKQFLYHTRHLDGSSSNTPGIGASFINLQEVLHHQLQDILSALNRSHRNTVDPQPTWSYIGVARDDGKIHGEYNPIIYPTALFSLLHTETVWLSSTPEKPSRGWDAGCNRVVVIGVFEHKVTKHRVCVANTHLDHAGTEARRKGVGVVLDVLNRIRKDWAGKDVDGGGGAGLRFVLTGDFNSFPSQEAYQAIVASDLMVDAHEVVDDEARYGDETTFTGFRPVSGQDQGEVGRIDYVWFGPKIKGKGNRTVDGWKVEGYATLPNVFDEGVFCSDHRCLVVDAVLL